MKPAQTHFLCEHFLCIGMNGLGVRSGQCLCIVPWGRSGRGALLHKLGIDRRGSGSAAVAGGVCAPTANVGGKCLAFVYLCVMGVHPLHSCTQGLAYALGGGVGEAGFIFVFNY